MEIVYSTMRPNRHRVGMLIAMMTFALLGLIALQAYLLNSAFALKEQTFKQNVWSALLAASLRLHTGETVTKAIQIGGSEPSAPPRIISAEASFIAEDSTTQKKDAKGARPTRDRMPVRIDGNTFIYRVVTPQRVRIEVTDLRGRDSVLVDSVKDAGEHAIPITKGEGRFLYRFTTDSNTVLASVVDGNPGTVLPRPRSDSARYVFVSQVVENLWTSSLEPVEKRYPQATLDSVVRQSMREAGIFLEVAFGVITSRSDTSDADTVHLASPPGSEPELLTSEFHTPLSPWAGPRLRERLAVDFPGRNLYLLSQLWPAFLSSLVFMILILGTFVYTIRTIMRQQRLAGHMVDFVNTMTHEFKTPISTIALTSEAIRRPDVVRRSSKVLQYNAIIADEATRMKKQVDRILQMAQIEEGDFELSITDVNVNELVTAAVSSFAVHVEARGGQLTVQLNAHAPLVRGDQVHLGNVLMSLLDNANKYTPDVPKITVTTRNRDGFVMLAIADEGAGISPEHQKRVFDKYYRVPHGNLHDVKGFGLGLSYVKSIVQAHNGSVSLESIPAEGTTVTVRLPLKATS